MSSANAEFDIIFAGGGASSCLIASRLADADPSLRILIVEAGPHTEGDLAHIQPARFLHHLAPDSKSITFMVANPEKELGDRQTVVPCGHCVGGGSSVNFMMYTRASASDYDDWEKKFGSPGWGADSLVPLLKKVETYEVAPGQHHNHGYSGPVRVSYGGVFTNIGKDFLEVGAKYDPTRESTDDPNGLFEPYVNKYGRWQKWISKEGKRQDVPHQFIYNKKHKNITLTTGHLVKRVIFESKRAVGIEYVQNPRVFQDATSTVTVARASRLVVVSAGAFGSPSILERSGIGAKSVLEKAGVELFVDLPGVGENYQDHQVMFLPYLASEESDTLDAIVRMEEPAFTNVSAEWQKTGKGLMAHNSFDAGLKLRPNEEERKAIGPAFDKKWKTFYANAPDKPVLCFAPASMFIGDPTTAPSRKYFSVGYYIEHSSSRGFVHIIDGQNPAIPPEFETGFLQSPDDLALLRWGYKRAREYARRMACYRGEYAPTHPQFSESSKALCNMEVPPVSMNAPDIEYTAEDDKAIETYTRKYVGTAWHSLGTCAMKPREQGGVVDSKLNVYGVERLKVADLSIPPSNVAANTYSTALAVAEKSALIIAEELGIQGV